MAKILGIESSCDETAAAVVEDGTRILSSVIASQLDTHGKYGGVVPELASREHLRAIVPVVREALERAGTDLDGLAAVAVTAGPGLVGSLLVGITYAKALAGTRTCSRSARGLRIGCWARRATMRRAKPSTRWESCSASATRAGR
jgi:tRNA A37 threonylcarbamoyltransferase TsaD